MNRITIYLALTLLITGSCKQKATQTLLPHVIGGMNDVVLVMSPKNWESKPGEVMQKELSQFVSSIPQEEPIFDIIWMPHDGFTSVIKKQRNIIVTKIGPEHQQKITYHTSLWAQSQIVIQISAKTPEEFIEFFNSKKDEIISRIQNAELERLMSDYKKSQDETIRKKIQKEHHLNLVVPKGYTVNLDTENLIWIDNRHRNIIEGILIYYYPYTDTNTFTKEFLIEKRNAIFKQYVPGEKEGSYPTTEMRYPIETYEYKLNGEEYTFELRGLWNVVGGFAMGGPFVSITQYDEENQRIVTVDGFLFAPGEEKRNLIKRLEAVLYSIKFDAKEKKQNLEN